MTEFRAGFGRADVTPAIGCRLIGYSNRKGGATGVHDRLAARALVLEDKGTRYALLAVEFCYVHIDSLHEIRAAVEARVGIAAANVFVAATHTHSGPHDRDAQNWTRPLAEIMADAVEAACAALQPARLGSGYGMLYGCSINRRWIDRPVDPAVAVLRIDDAAGQPLGLVSNFGCHAVVLGADNLLISGDWPGHACRRLEAQLGNGATCLFLQGGAGDVNPLVQGVREALHSGRRVVSIGNISAYYGAVDASEPYNVGNRSGGTFAEVAELGDAFAREVLHVAQGIRTDKPAAPVWSQQVVVKAAADPDENRPAPLPEALALVSAHPDALRAEGIPAEIMLLGIDDALLVSQPGEVFSETAVNLRVQLRLLGYRTPMLVSYANGRLTYLPEPYAYDEGGYEPGRADQLGISPRFQARVWDAVQPIAQQRARALPAR